MASADIRSDAIRWEHRAVVIADLVESVRLIQSDEAGTIGRWRDFVADVRERLLPLRRGRLVKSLGDGLLVEFAQPRDAAAFALDLHDTIARQNVGTVPTAHLRLRVGMTVGDIVVDEIDVYGAGVNLAARLAALASPGGTVLSAHAKDQLVEGLDVDVEDLGECYLKHIEAPVRAFRIFRPTGGLRPLVEATSALVPERAQVPLAVVPFRWSQAPGDEATDDCLGHLIADGVIGLLARSPHLRVISRLSTEAFRDRPDADPVMFDRLGAAYVLSGLYRRAGSRLLVIAELARTRDLTTVWGDRILVDPDDPLQPRSELLETLAERIAQAITATEWDHARVAPLATLADYSLQLGGISLMHRSAGVEFARARDVLEYLVERHPRAAEARAWLAKWYVLRVTRGIVRDVGSEAAIAMAHIRRALDVDPGCSLALGMQGFVRCHMLKDPMGALESIDAALDANPNDSLAWLFKGVVYSLLGNGEPALEAVDRARALSPLDPLQYYYDALSAPAALSAGRWELAVSIAQESLRRNRIHSQNLRSLVIGLVKLGRFEEARDSVRLLLDREPSLTVRGYLERSPAGVNETRRIYAEALAEAGVPRG